MNNKYVNRSKISEAKFRELVRFFSLDLTAIQVAELTGLNRNTVNRYLTEIRKKISRYTEATSPVLIKNQPERDIPESVQYVILIKEQEGKIYTQVLKKSDVYSLKKHEEHFDLIIDLKSGKQDFKAGKKETGDSLRRKLNRIESFWGNAKSRLSKFKGMHASTFRFHLKECEFRYNNRNEDLYQLLLKILRNDPLF